MLEPWLAICCWIVALAPWPMLTIAITAPTPMMMPSIVRVERSLFRPSARSATRIKVKKMIIGSILQRRHPGYHLGRDASMGHSLVLQDAAVAKGDDALGEIGDVGLVRHQDDRQVLTLVQLLEDLHDVDARPAVEVPGRFVRQQQRRAVDERTGDGHALLLTARELRRDVVAPVPEAHARERFLRAPVPLLCPYAGVDER